MMPTRPLTAVAIAGLAFGVPNPGVAAALEWMTPGLEQQASGPKVSIVLVVGCVQRGAHGEWLLTNASEPRVSAIVHADAKEIADARSTPLGTGRYRLIGTAEFGSAGDLLSQGQRAQFTTPEGANATGQLAAGRRVSIKALLIPARNEDRLNLLSVQPIAEACP
jgi:hypothetical protein